MVKPNEWGQGKNCTFFMWNDVPRGYADSPRHRNPKQSGKLKIDMTFQTNPGVHITVLVWGEFKGAFVIDSNASVLYKND